MFTLQNIFKIDDRQAQGHQNPANAKFELNSSSLWIAKYYSKAI